MLREYKVNITEIETASILLLIFLHLLPLKKLVLRLNFSHFCVHYIDIGPAISRMH